MSTRIGATARVTLTIEVEAGQAWGTECTVEQIHKQAKEAVLGKLRNGIGVAKQEQRGYKIIGDPKVTAVLTHEER